VRLAGVRLAKEGGAVSGLTLSPEEYPDEKRVVRLEGVRVAEEGGH